MKKPVIMWDLDDTVWDFNRPFSEFMGGITGTKVEYEDLWSFHFQDIYGLPEEAMSGHIQHFCHNHHEKIVLYPDSIPGLRSLQGKAHQLSVTARKDKLADITHQHLINSGIADLFAEVRFSNLKSKLDICKEVGATVAVDDAVHNATELAAAGIKVYMPRRPWNREIGKNDIPNLTPVSGPQEAALLIQQRFSL